MNRVSLHPFPLVRWAPWLLLVAVLFLLVFVPLGLLPEVARRADLGADLELARTSASQAEQVAAEMAQAAAELPALREELARAEQARMIPLEKVPGAGTTLAAHARATGVTLLSVGYGPFARLAATGDAESTGATGSTGSAGSAQTPAEEPSPAGERSPAGGASPAGGPSASADGDAGLPYGQVSLDVTARGTWANLARFAGRLETAMPGLRITSWSVSGEPGDDAYELHLSGVLYVAGLPPVPQAIGEPPEGGQPSGQAGGQPSAQTGGQVGGPAAGS
ncbi:MAG TPA: hypothetical protein VIK99_10545 [Thermaerobacter sp.]